MASAGVASAGVASAGVATDGVATDGVGSEGATTAGVAPLATALMVAISRLETWTRVFCEAACRDCRTSADECTRRPLTCTSASPASTPAAAAAPSGLTVPTVSTPSATRSVRPRPFSRDEMKIVVSTQCSSDVGVDAAGVGSGGAGAGAGAGADADAADNVAGVTAAVAMAARQGAASDGPPDAAAKSAPVSAAGAGALPAAVTVSGVSSLSLPTLSKDKSLRQRVSALPSHAAEAAAPSSPSSSSPSPASNVASESKKPSSKAPPSERTAAAAAAAAPGSKALVSSKAPSEAIFGPIDERRHAPRDEPPGVRAGIGLSAKAAQPSAEDAPAGAGAAWASPKAAAEEEEGQPDASLPSPPKAVANDAGGVASKASSKVAAKVAAASRGCRMA